VWAVMSCFLLAAPFAAAQDFDLLIRGGQIVDGTGNPSFAGDVGIRVEPVVAQPGIPVHLLAGSAVEQIMA
ncbi:MAG TPA: hypothetical protein VLW65_07455, partial [Bryobacteraceae bacterium]|nr:hypothetical protein [Bryobacteraceae bacterium]